MSKEIFHKVIFGVPYIKKNNQRVIYHRYLKRNIVVYSAKYQFWEKEAMKQLGLSNNGKWVIDKNMPRLIEHPVILKCHFYLGDRRIRDISALYEGIQDVLVKSQILKDDNYNIIIGHDGSRCFYDKENPRMEIWLYKKRRQKQDTNNNSIPSPVGEVNQ